jgi:hypothetical protein
MVELFEEQDPVIRFLLPNISSNDAALAHHATADSSFDSQTFVN